MTLHSLVTGVAARDVRCAVKARRCGRSGPTEREPPIICLPLIGFACRLARVCAAACRQRMTLEM